MTLSAFRRDGQRPLGLIYISPLAFVRCEAALGPSQAGFQTSVSRSKIGRLEPSSPVGFGRGQPCFMRHLILGFHNRRG